MFEVTFPNQEPKNYFAFVASIDLVVVVVVLEVLWSTFFLVNDN